MASFLLLQTGDNLLLQSGGGAALLLQSSTDDGGGGGEEQGQQQGGGAVLSAATAEPLIGYTGLPSKKLNPYVVQVSATFTAYAYGVAKPIVIDAPQPEARYRGRTRAIAECSVGHNIEAVTRAAPKMKVAFRIVAPPDDQLVAFLMKLM